MPTQSLEAQWIATFLHVHALNEEARAEELRDLETEFDLRGARPPLALVVPELVRFRERFAREPRKRRPDPFVIERARAEVEAVADRLIDAQRAA